MVSENPYLVFSGSKSQYLTEQICKSLGCSMGRMTTQHFADGEFAVSYEESIRGRDVFLVQSTFPSADNLMELLLMIDAAKRASAHYITAVVPYFGWARQDRKDKPRVSIGAKLIADLLSTAGITRLITMDLHADQIQGFFDVPVDHLYASSVFMDYIEKTMPMDNLVVATPDVGGTKRASSYARYLPQSSFARQRSCRNAHHWGCRRQRCTTRRRYCRYSRHHYQECGLDAQARSQERARYGKPRRNERPCYRAGK